MEFKIRKKSSVLATFSAEIYGPEGQLIYTVWEEPGTLGKKIVRLTKWRTALSLKIAITEIISGKVYFLNRNPGIWREEYFVTGGDGATLFSFVPKRFDWRLFERKWEIRDGYGEKIGIYHSGTLKILGPMEARVTTLSGDEISRLIWERPSFFRTPRECVVSVNDSRESWIMISLTAAILKALFFERR